MSTDNRNHNPSTDNPTPTQRPSSGGIDYSGPYGTCNRNLETGIRYGIIPMNSLGEWAWESIESEYDPSCPNCGKELGEGWDTETTPEEWAHAHDIEVEDIDPEDLERIEAGRVCLKCHYTIGDGEEYPEEPTRNVIREGEEESGFVDDSNDLWVVESPYYTHARFCSPCAPGACYLTSPTDTDGPRAYCLGPDWFDEGAPCPYPIYRVSDGALIHPASSGD